MESVDLFLIHALIRMVEHDTYFYKEITPSPEIGFQYTKIPIDEIGIVGDDMVFNIPKVGDVMRNLYFDMGQNTLDTLEYIEILMSKTIVFRFTGEYLYMKRVLQTPTQMKPLLNNVISLPIGTIPMAAEMTVRARIHSPTIQKNQIGLTAEVGYFKKKMSEFGTLIEQMQLCTSTEDRIQLKFQHCIKEIFIVVQNTNASGFQFSDAVDRIKLELNQNEKFNEDAMFLRYIQPMMYHTSFQSDDTAPFYTYSFAIDPENIRPTGTLNASRINSMILTISFLQSFPKNIRVYTTSYNYLYVKEDKATLKYIL